MANPKPTTAQDRITAGWLVEVTSPPLAALRTGMDPQRRDRTLQLATRAAGHDVTPGHDELHHYWTVDPEGRGKWIESDEPWTTLVAHLTPKVGPLKAKTYASRWFIEVFGYAAGSDKNRVAHGHPPRGKLIGPG